MNSDDRTFIKDKLTGGDAGKLPESLAPENVVALVAGAAQEKPKRRRLAPVIASLAAVLAIAAGLTLAIRFTGGVRVKNSASMDQTAAPEETSPAAEAQAQDYSALGKTLAQAMQERNYYFGYSGNSGMKSAVDDAAAPEANTAAPPALPETSYNTNYDMAQEDHSELNTRTEGVDETDLIRTDGRYIYVLNNASPGYGAYYRGFYGWMGVNTERIGNPQRLLVIDPANGQIAQAGEYTLSLTPADATEVTKERSYNGFYLYKNYVILTGTEMRFTEGELRYNEEEQYWDVGGTFRIQYLTVVTVLDVSDPAAVTPVKELFYDGDLQDTRIVGNRLITVSRFAPDGERFDETDYTTFVPRACVDGAYLPADRIHVADPDSPVYTLVSVTDLENGLASNALAVLGCADGLYMSENNLYCYGSRYEEKGNRWEQYLAVSKVDVSGANPTFIATGQYKDIALFDSFAVDEFNGTLRMAVQTVSRWDALDNLIPVRNYILTLDENLNVLGQSKSFGENETIRGVRFSGEKAYVVTFLNTDPLFVFDLSDPANPVTTGETKLPGFSAYLHPAGEGYMIGVGYDGTEDGITDAAKISLFDVSDPENPVEADRLVLDSAAFDTDYKRFITKGENGFIVPYYQWDYNGSASGAVYFTVENGKIVLQSKIELPEKTNSALAVYIGENLYFYTQRYTYVTTTDEYGYTYEEASAPICEMYSFALSTGDPVAKLDLN